MCSGWLRPGGGGQMPFAPEGCLGGVALCGCVKGAPASMAALASSVTRWRGSADYLLCATERGSGHLG